MSTLKEPILRRSASACRPSCKDRIVWSVCTHNRPGPLQSHHDHGGGRTCSSSDSCCCTSSAMGRDAAEESAMRQSWPSSTAATFPSKSNTSTSSASAAARAASALAVDAACCSRDGAGGWGGARGDGFAAKICNKQHGKHVCCVAETKRSACNCQGSVPDVTAAACAWSGQVQAHHHELKAAAWLS